MMPRPFPRVDFSKLCRTLESIRPLNAFVSINDLNLAEKCLGQSDERWGKASPRGALDGVTVAVKDNFCFKGLNTTCASNMLRSYRPPYTATVVQKCVDAGAVVIGKTNLDEFAMGSGCVDSIFGPTKSVWRSGIDYQLVQEDGQVLQDIETNPETASDWYISGGSSGGSAVAVSSGVCSLALGSDTGGSVRIPGAWNGIVTLKPTYGALSRHGLIPLVNSLDVPGLMAGSVSEIATFFNVLKGADEFDSTTVQYPNSDVKIESDPDMSQITVGIPVEYHCQGMSEEVLQMWSDITDLLEKNSVRVVSVSLPHIPYSIVCYSVLNPCEVSSNMARYDGVEYGLRGHDMTSTEAMFAQGRHKGFNEVVRGRILAGNYFLLKENYSSHFLQAMKVRRLVSNDFDLVFNNKVDLLLTPVTLTDAPSYSDFSRLDNRTQTTKQDYCTQPVNLAGLPAATIPVRLSKKHLPLSLQVIGKKFEEEKVLRLCKWIEKRVKFPKLVVK